MASARVSGPVKDQFPGAAPFGSTTLAILMLLEAVVEIIRLSDVESAAGIH